MSVDPITLLTGLDEPLGPRQEFGDALLERLVAELESRPRRGRLVLALAAAAALLLAGIATATYLLTRTADSSPVAPVGNGPLTIVSGGVLATIDPDGRLTPVWRCPATDCGYVTGFAWAPAASRLAIALQKFGRSRGALGLHIFETRTRADRRVSPGQLGCATPRDPAWSPEGARIAYACAGAIFSIRPDGADRRLAAAKPGGTGTLSSPSWSPDARRLVFALRTGTPLHGSSSLFVVNADGSGLHLLVRGGTAPAWSPDGTRIAYRAGCGGIKLVAPDGRDVTPIRRGRCGATGVSGIPIWSPDGTKIAIANHLVRTTHGGIYVMDADGSQLRLASKRDWRGLLGFARPAWRPVPGGRKPHRPGCTRKGCL